MIKKVFFDLDGTIIDQKYAQNEAVKALYNEYGFNQVTALNAFVQKWDQLTELHYDSYLKRECTYEEQRIRRVVDLFAFFNIPIAEGTGLRIYDVYLERFEANWQLFSDVKEVICKLHEMGFEMGIITNGDITQQRLKLKRTKIDQYFKYLIAAGEYEFAKPDPEIFRVACQKCDMTYSDFIYIGDSYKSDVVPCKKLGIKCLLLNRSGKQIPDDTIDIIASCDEIINYISSITA